MTRGTTASLAVCLALAASCANDVDTTPAQARESSALFVNGGFEDGTLGSWTHEMYRNQYGLRVVPPASFADLQLVAPALGPDGKPVNQSTQGPWDLTFARRGVDGRPESAVPYRLSSGVSLRYPKFGSWAAVVAEAAYPQPGAVYSAPMRNTNTLRQSYTTTNADVDPADGKIHIRFVLAPVLENPGHPPAQQPYFYATVRNVTRSKQLFSKFAYANQPGVPWKSDPVRPSYLYTDWQAFDIAPSPVDLQPGDTVELLVVAASCSPSAHFGEVYVDAFGSFLPGLTVAASAPAEANSGMDLTYRYLVTNSGTAMASAVVVQQPIPAGTTFQRVDAPGATCTAPPVGAGPGTGVPPVSCNIGPVNANASATLEITFRIAATSGKVSNGSYTVAAAGISPLIGPLVETTITAGVAYADLAIVKSDGIAATVWGDPVRYTIQVANAGPSAANGAAVRDLLPPQLAGATWTCSAAPQGSCAAPSGSGNVDTTVSLPAGSVATFVLDATIVAGSGKGEVTNVASVSPPAGVVDNTPGNDTAVDKDTIGTRYVLAVAKDAASTGGGRIVSSPAGIDCESCSAPFTEDTLVSLTAIASAGDTFTGWTGACAGAANPCLLTIAGDAAVGAIFTSPKKANGAACAGPTDCLSGSCADGVCCDSSCTEQCKACNLAGALGSCTFVTGAPPPSRPSCQGAGTCGGSCDGASPRCTYPGAETECRAASCAEGIETAAASCDGAGACPAPATEPCAPYVCGASACLESCATFADCSAGDYCSGEGNCLDDTVPPVLVLPAPPQVEASGPSGAAVTFAASATDDVATVVSVACAPPSGSTFAFGDTTVTCTADDGHGNAIQGSFVVTVRDTTPPAITGTPVLAPVEATGPTTAVSFAEPSAEDAVDGPVQVDCVPPSGSPFAVGTTQVTCSASDSRGNQDGVSFDVVVTDATPPSIVGVPAPAPVEATGPGGAAVSWFAPLATDLVDLVVAVSCTPAPGTFPIGSTVVTCEATDHAGNTASVPFTVTVQDTTPPLLAEVPAPSPFEATGPAGAAVSWSGPVANDVVDGARPVSCAPPSGTVVAVGATVPVFCTSSDTRGNAASAAFDVSVVDTTPPAVTVPGPLTAAATSAAGAQVSYTASALDVVSGALTPGCDHPSGSVFPPGTTLVTCAATDAAGNTGTASFPVLVRFDWTGLLQPVNQDGSSVFRLGRTVPCKFRLAGASAGITAAAAVISVAPVTNEVIGSEQEAESTSAATEGSAFRYDPSADQYIFNLSTDGMGPGTWIVRVNLGDGVPHDTWISLR